MQEKKSKTSGQELTQSSPAEQRDIFEECAEKCLTEDERSALASVPDTLPFAARMVAAQNPAAKSVVVLKKEVSGHDPDFLSVIHNQLATLSVTKNGTAAGYSFVRSVLKEATQGTNLKCCWSRKC